MGQTMCCFRPSSTTQEQQQTARKKRKDLREKNRSTVEECLNSIKSNPHPKKKVYPSSPDFDNTTPFHTPRMSFKVEEAKLKKKKVTFKLPEEDDVVFFYSPKQTFDCISAS